MRTVQAEVFGFPNALLGIAGFAVVTTVGVAIAAVARLPRWFWFGMQAGVTLGVVFVHWLIYQSRYVIGALCPYCMIVWAVSIPVFWYVTLHNLHEGHLPPLPDPKACWSPSTVWFSPSGTCSSRWGCWRPSGSTGPASCNRLRTNVSTHVSLCM
jgi:hypothetical protein